MAQGRHINKCWELFSDLANGAKGSAVIMENLSTPNPRIFSSHAQTPAHQVWRYAGPPSDPYQVEFDLLLDAIRNDQPHNESERCAKACLTAILGRMAVESGRLWTWDEAFSSNVELAPGLDQLTWESSPPVQPDSTGHYPLPVPGSSAG